MLSCQELGPVITLEADWRPGGGDWPRPRGEVRRCAARLPAIGAGD